MKNNKEAFKIKGKGLCWYNDDTLILYRGFSFYLYNVITKNKVLIGKMPISFLKKILCSLRISRRILRLEPSSFIDIKNGKYLFSFDWKIYSLDIVSNKISFENDISSRTLLTIVHDEISDASYAGMYPMNHSSKTVDILKRDSNGKWSVYYSFEPKSIRHIHRLMINDDRLLCFTGDENKEVNMISFNKNNSSDMTVLANGEQKFRTCLACQHNKDIYYVNDSPYFTNYVVKMDSENNVNFLYDLKGSVIYGTYQNDYLFFSTVVENNLSKSKNGENVKIRIDGKNGGIKSKTSYFYLFDCSNQKLTELYSAKKDILPYKFGLGTFMPVQNYSKKYIGFYSSGLKNDGKTIVISNKY